MHILLVGETWLTVDTIVNGANVIPGRVVQHNSAGPLIAALAARGSQVDHVPGDLVLSDFPSSTASLSRYDAVILSDVGVDSFNLTPPPSQGSSPPVDRLQMLADYVHEGGGLLTVGGYMSYAGFAGVAGYGRSVLAQALPVEVATSDDRIERPSGAVPVAQESDHEVLRGVSSDWPALLGYNRLRARETAIVPLMVDDHPLLALGDWGRGRVAAFASDCAPHWASEEFLSWDSYGTFFSNVLAWVAQTDSDGRP